MATVSKKFQVPAGLDVRGGANLSGDVLMSSGDFLIGGNVTGSGTGSTPAKFSLYRSDGAVDEKYWNSFVDSNHTYKIGRSTDAGVFTASIELSKTGQVTVPSGAFSVGSLSNSGTSIYSLTGSGVSSVVQHSDPAGLVYGQVTNSGIGAFFQSVTDFTWQAGTSSSFTWRHGVVPRFQITASGDFISRGGLIGYGAGAGGTVTQATSKYTNVTLNKPSGRITLANTSMAAGELAYFILQNNTISVDDVCVVNVAGGSASFPEKYEVRVLSSTTGNCYIGVKNIAATAQTDAIVLKFVVIKGSQA